MIRRFALTLRWASRVLERWADALLRRPLPEEPAYRYTVTHVEGEGVSIEPCDRAIIESTPGQAPVVRLYRTPDLPPGTKL